MNTATRALACAGLLGLAGILDGQELGPAPRFDAPQVTDPGRADSVDLEPLDRYTVSIGYRRRFVPLASVPHGWTGNVDTCSAGTTSNAYQQAAIDRVNFYRALAGLPGNVALISGDVDVGPQAAALIMSRNNAASNNPPQDWACWSAAGANAAQNSNVAVSVGGTDAIDLYVDDPGVTFVPHRRWILFPPQAHMSSGSIPGGTGFLPSNVLRVIGGAGSTQPPTPNGVAWPPRGFVPYQMLPAISNFWSLSYPGANFNAATVAMSTGGSSFAVTLQVVQGGYGDSTIVWRPFVGSPGVSYERPTDADRRYSVTVGNVSGNGVPTSFAYDVIVIDPADAVFNDGFDDALFADGFE